MFLKLGPFLLSYFCIFVLRTQGAASDEIKLIVAYNVLVEDGDVYTGCLQTGVPKECCPDMDREPVPEPAERWGYGTVATA